MPMISPLVFRPENPVEEKRMELWTWISTRRVTPGDRGEVIKAVRLLMQGNINPRQWERGLGIADWRRIELGRLRLAFNVAQQRDNGNTGIPEKL